MLKRGGRKDADHRFYMKCPNCHTVKRYTSAESEHLYILCKNCGKEFRAAECSPLTGGEAKMVEQEIAQSQREARSDLPTGVKSTGPNRPTARQVPEKRPKEESPRRQPSKQQSPKQESSKQEPPKAHNPRRRRPPSADARKKDVESVVEEKEAPPAEKKKGLIRRLLGL